MTDIPVLGGRHWLNVNPTSVQVLVGQFVNWLSVAEAFTDLVHSTAKETQDDFKGHQGEHDCE